MIRTVRYSPTNTYLIEGRDGMLLFDTGWAGTFAAFCNAMGQLGISVQSIRAVMVSHFHPDHMGIVSDIAACGAEIWVMDVQKDYVHATDGIFMKDARARFVPIDDSKVTLVPIGESRTMLSKLGIDGEVLHTPGHSDDSVSLFLDSGELLVGDLNPLYELPLHKGTLIGDSWEKLLSKKPKKVYYGHAKEATLAETELREALPTGVETAHGRTEVTPEQKETAPEQTDYYALVKRIMKLIDKRTDLDTIAKKTGADRTLVEDVARMYLTHQNVGVQGILDRIEIKNR